MVESLKDSLTSTSKSTQTAMHPFITAIKISGLKVYDIEIKDLEAYLQDLITKLDDLLVDNI